MSLFSELKRRNVFRIGAAYAVSAWLIIQVAETIFPLFGYGDTPARIVVVIAVAAFIPTVVLSWFFALTPQGLQKETEVDRSRPELGRPSRKLDFAIIGVLVFALAYFFYDKLYLDPARDSLATLSAVEGLAEVRALAGNDQYAEAYARAKELERIFVDAALRNELWSMVSSTASVRSHPAGAQVWVRPYNSSEDDWETLGRTPLTGVRLPLKLARYRVELEGHRPLSVAWNLDWGAPNFELDPIDDLPETMVRVTGGTVDVVMPGLGTVASRLPEFLIDKFEVTNKEYQEFVDAGGYSNPELWDHEFLADGEALPFADAVARFKDKTGRPGPSTWQLGEYPDGTADHPVAGISWYEAAAYAKFRNKELPTIYHWYSAADPPMSKYILPKSNFSKEGTAPVGTYDGLSWSGLYDGAGNVREWIWNEHNGNRFLLGGAWSDPEYMFTDANAQSPWDRSEINGVRLMISLDNQGSDSARAPITLQGRDYRAEEPVSDELYRVFARQFAYDKSPLNVQVAATEETEYWVRERIELNAAYGDERLITYLFIPRGRQPPYLPVIYFPGSGSIYLQQFPPADEFRFDFLMRSGYAVVYPVYKGTFERDSELPSDVQDESNSYRNHVVSWSQDLGRSLDYLESRSEFDLSRLMYMGFSWGSSIAPIMIAVEPRIKFAVLLSGGLVLNPTQPEVDPFNYLPRVTIPTKMINVPNDYFFKLENSQKPFFETLGSQYKEHVLLEGGHLPPMNEVARETLDWIDKYRDMQP